MPDQPFQPSNVDRFYWLRHLLPKLALLAAWTISYFEGGGELPTTAKGVITLCCIVFLILYDGNTSIKGAKQIAPPR